MKLIAFFPNPPHGDNFGDILTRDMAKQGEGELFLVCAEYTDSKSSHRMTDFFGLDFALTLDRGESPMIICSFMPEAFFSKDKKLSKKFFALMAKKRVCFMRIPLTPYALQKKQQELLADKKDEDLLAIELNSMASFDDIMGTIQHRVSRYFGEESEGARKEIARAVAEAKSKLQLTGNDEDIALQIQNFRPSPGRSLFIGKFFPGVFCDIENTLLINGEVNKGMLKKLQDFSKTKPITLWTGATLEIDDIKKKLIEHGITWKLVPKIAFNGAEVETAYDNEKFSEFFKKYGINVREFIQI